MSRRAVVFGAAGQLGAELVTALKQRGYEVDAWDRKDVDVTEVRDVEAALARADAEVVFNAASYNQVDVSERDPQLAFQVNALAVRNMAQMCRQVDVKLVHFSTDYVFDGFARHPYAEDDPTHPLGAYAVSKLAGEMYAQAYLDRVLVVRTSGVFGVGGLSTARGNFIELMLRLARSGQPIRVVEDHVASPTFAPLLAAGAIELAERGRDGLFHIGGGAPISWFDYARMIFDVAGLKPALQPTNELEYRTLARRPKYSALSNGKAERFGVAPMPPLREAVEAYFGLRARALAGQA